MAAVLGCIDVLVAEECSDGESAQPLPPPGPQQRACRTRQRPTRRALESREAEPEQVLAAEPGARAEPAEAPVAQQQQLGQQQAQELPPQELQLVSQCAPEPLTELAAEAGDAWPGKEGAAATESGMQLLPHKHRWVWQVPCRAMWGTEVWVGTPPARRPSAAARLRGAHPLRRSLDRFAAFSTFVGERSRLFGSIAAPKAPF